ncbi:hypothetical protein H5410_020775 [Solanum commersonii]|uniref:Glycosyltransferase N-terminal domain-containing protein n=1 Tax=Solanum commersonii TaxID=4109 RepID=A0A9J5ZF83_SOLCO|nr:hypothetical protein H5410_020775 [Solanum commersonii]
MVPLPAQSHLNQLLQLACIFSSSSYNLHVYYVDIAKIFFYDIPIPYFDSHAPDPNALSEFTAQLLPFYNACMLLRKFIASPPCANWLILPQTELLKTGLVIREWKKHEELVTASAIENVVRKLVASEEGDEIRKRAEDLGAAVRESIDKGGVSQLEVDSYIAY